MSSPCHAGAGHGPATDRGHFGWLCEPCWTWCQRFIKRLNARAAGKETR